MLVDLLVMIRFFHPLRLCCCVTFIVALSGGQNLFAQELQTNSPALPAVPPKGLIAYKLHRQADDFAPCVEYSRIKMFPLVVNLTTTENRFLSVQQGQVASHLSYPPVNEELLSDEDITRLQMRIRDYEAVGKRFKYAAPLVRPWIARFRYEIEMLEQGLGRVDGRWVNRSSYMYERERARLQERFAARKAQILKEKSEKSTPTKPSLWAYAMEAQLKAEQEAFRKAFKKRVAERKAADTEEFHRTVESKLSRRTPSKLAPSNLSPADSLNTRTDLDKSSGL